MAVQRSRRARRCLPHVRRWGLRPGVYYPSYLKSPQMSANASLGGACVVVVELPHTSCVLNRSPGGGAVRCGPGTDAAVKEAGAAALRAVRVGTAESTEVGAGAGAGAENKLKIASLPRNVVECGAAAGCGRVCDAASSQSRSKSPAPLGVGRTAGAGAGAGVALAAGFVTGASSSRRSSSGVAAGRAAGADAVGVGAGAALGATAGDAAPSSTAGSDGGGPSRAQRLLSYCGE